MGTRATLLLLLLALVVCHGALITSMAMGFYSSQEGEWRPKGGGSKQGQEEEEEGWSSTEGGGAEPFLLKKSKRVVQTEAGEMRVVPSYGSRMIMQKPLHFGFITMEPNSLFVPQYLDSNLILFIRRGEAKLGFIYRDDLAERRLKEGDIYRIPAGSAFYLLNVQEGQRLHVICSIDTTESFGFGPFQTFYIGGGSFPLSILSGFESDTLSTAFNVTREELRELMSGHKQGPIVYVDDSRSPSRSMWSEFLKLKERDRLKHLRSYIVDNQEDQDQTTWSWSWGKLIDSVFLKTDKKGDGKKGKSPDSFNIYNRRADFKNDYGWTIAVDDSDSDYKSLKTSGIGVYLVNLTAGSMLAPHMNPSATEYGVVLRGSGRIQIVYPNGTKAMDEHVNEGDVFWVPRFFPFCQIASRTGPFEFFGFTTSAEKNRPQFLVGASSILQTLEGPELAASFRLHEGRVRRFIHAQREAVILPSASAAPPYDTGKKKKKQMPHLVKNIRSDMVRGFD